MRSEDIKKTFSDYFHPKSLWKEGSMGKAKAVGAVISWGTIVIPMIMGIGLAISTSRLHKKVKKNTVNPTSPQGPTTQKVEVTFAKTVDKSLNSHERLPQVTPRKEGNSPSAKIIQVSKNSHERLPLVTPKKEGNAKELSNLSPQKIQGSKTKEYTIPKNINPKFYEKLDKKFIGEVLDSNLYSSQEKDMLFKGNPTLAYRLEEQIYGPTAWIDENVTIAYLKGFAFKNRSFSTFHPDQFEDHDLEGKIGNVLGALPSKIDQGPRIYGHPLRVNGNHRTAFVIDMDNRTVEYFNSFGDDIKAKAPLTALTNALTNKYRVPFTYHHRTPNISLQPNSYDCGIWTGKLIEERVKQGKNFNPATLGNFNIAQYRTQLQADAYKLYFFQDVGRARLDAYVRQNIKSGGSEEELKYKEDELTEKIYELAEEKFQRPAGQIMDLFCIEWGKGSQNQIPDPIKNLVQQAKVK